MRPSARGHAPLPRHLAGATGSVPAPAGDEEAAPRVPVPRSRLALALAITVAALPVIVLDNLAATAETNDEVVRTTVDTGSSSSSLGTRPSTVPSSTVVEVPATTVPPTTEALDTTPAAEEAPTAAPVATSPPPTAPPATSPPVTSPPATAPPSVAADPDDPATWDRLAVCESGGRWGLDTGNGYYGGLQFSLATWQNVGGAGYPNDASRDEQIHRGQILQAAAGWGQWPHCARELGYL